MSEREKVLAMPEGPELDVLVRKHVFKSDVFEIPAGWAYKTDTSWRFIPHYSSSISAAWEMEEKALEIGKKDDYGIELYLITGACEKVASRENLDVFKIAHATPEQRCKAALLAVMDL